MKLDRHSQKYPCCRFILPVCACACLCVCVCRCCGNAERINIRFTHNCIKYKLCSLVCFACLKNQFQTITIRSWPFNGQIESILAITPACRVMHSRLLCSSTYSKVSIIPDSLHSLVWFSHEIQMILPSYIFMVCFASRFFFVCCVSVPVFVFLSMVYSARSKNQRFASLCYGHALTSRQHQCETQCMRTLNEAKQICVGLLPWPFHKFSLNELLTLFDVNRNPYVL